MPGKSPWPCLKPLSPWRIEIPPNQLQVRLREPGRVKLRWGWGASAPGHRYFEIHRNHGYIQYGYGSIPINTIFSGMNIHLPSIDTLPYEFRVSWIYDDLWHECHVFLQLSCFSWIDDRPTMLPQRPSIVRSPQTIADQALAR